MPPSTASRLNPWTNPRESTNGFRVCHQLATRLPATSARNLLSNMVRDAIIRALRHVALLDGLSPLQITEIARQAERIVFKPEATIIAAGAAADSAIIILSGNAECTDGPCIASLPQPLPEGTIITEMAMLIETHATTTIKATSEVRALKICRDDMLRLLADEPAIAEHFVSKAAARLQAIANNMRGFDLAIEVEDTASEVDSKMPQQQAKQTAVALSATSVPQTTQ